MPNRLPRILAAAALAVGAALPLTLPATAEDTAPPFKVAVNGEPDTLDVTSTREALAEFVSLENVYEPLVSTDVDGKLVPALATAWDIAPDGKKITFHLRHGVKFHSGDGFTSADVAFTYARELKHTPYVRREIAKVVPIDPYTVEIDFKYPSAGFLPSRSMLIVSKAYYERVGEATFVHHPVGTGPYSFVAYKDGQYLDLKRFDGYWGPKPEVARARFVFIKDDNTRTAALEAGEVDMAMNIPYPSVAKLKDDGFTLARLRAHPTIALQFNLANKDLPWAKREVRIAMAHAIDREAIVKGLLLGIPDFTPGLEPGELGYDPDLKAYAYDPALAKKMLAEAGYPNGFDMPLNYWSGNAFGIKETTEAAALYLQAAGIRTKIGTLDNVQVMQTIRRVHDDPKGVYATVVAHPWANESDPVEMFNIVFNPTSPFAFYHPQDFWAVAQKAIAAYDPQARAKYIREGMAIVHHDEPMIPLWNNVAIYAMKKTVSYVPTKKHFPVVTLANVKIGH